MPYLHQIEFYIEIFCCYGNNEVAIEMRWYMFHHLNDGSVRNVHYTRSLQNHIQSQYNNALERDILYNHFDMWLYMNVRTSIQLNLTRALS